MVRGCPGSGIRDAGRASDQGPGRHGVCHGLREDREAREVSVSSGKSVPEQGAGKDGRIHGVRVTSEGRRVYPGIGLTKGVVAEHYGRVAGRMLRYVADRPLSLLRCPGGIAGECFFQKHAGKGFPDEVKSLPIEEKDGETKDYMFVDSGRGLIAAAQMGTLEFHIWGATRDRLERPDRMVFDLDPDPGLDFATVKNAAHEVREGLAACGLDSAPMVTGGKGIHVIVSLRRIRGWDTVKFFAKTFAAVLAERQPDRYTASLSKSARKGRVFVDWLRNERGATAVAPYSLRARPGAAVAVPVTWEELATLDRPDGFHPDDMDERLSRPCPLEGAVPRGIGAGVVDALDAWARG